MIIVIVQLGDTTLYMGKGITREARAVAKKKEKTENESPERESSLQKNINVQVVRFAITSRTAE